MNLAWFVPGVILFAVGALSIAPVAHFLGKKPVLQFWTSLGIVVFIICGIAISTSASDGQTGEIVLISVAGVVVLEVLFFDSLKKRNAPVQIASEEAESSDEDEFDELPDENELVVGREYAVRTEGKRAVGVLRAKTPTRLLLQDPLRGWYVVYRHQISGYGPKDS